MCELDSASLHERQWRPSKCMGKPAKGAMGQQERRALLPGVFGDGMYSKESQGTWETRRNGQDSK